jgi:hypothetical protein
MKIYLHGRWSEGDRDVDEAVMGDLCPGGLHFKDILQSWRPLHGHWLEQEEDVARHFGDVGDLEARLGLASHDHVVEDKLIFLFSVHTSRLSLKKKMK